MDFGSFFNPQSVAVVGSMSPGKLGSILVNLIVEGGYQGRLYAINPKAEGFGAVPGFSSLSDIDPLPELAVIVSPAATVAAVLEECGRAGVHAAVIITSGFSEVGNHQAEKELLETARKYGIRFVGPNCAGLANAPYQFFPTLEMKPPPGKVALVSQSGALGGVVLGWAAQKGLGISKFVSFGNGADLTVMDFLYYLSEDDESEVIALYIESVSDGRALMRALRVCSRKKPVVVIKSGRTAAGTRATASHTGSMAGSDAVYEAAIRASGAVRVRSVEELLDLCEGFISAPPVRGKRLAIVTNSGGPGVLAADRAEELGLLVDEPSASLQQEMRVYLPPNCSLKNPVDLTVEGTEEGFRRSLLSMLKEYDAGLAINVSTSYLDTTGLARGVADAAIQSGKPIFASFVPQQLVAAGSALMKDAGVVNYPSGERAVNVIAAMQHYLSSRSDAENVAADETVKRLSSAAKPLPGGNPMLEPEAMDWLRLNGIPTPPLRLVSNASEVVKACEELGFPVVMKVVSPDILHKSDVGGVIVNIQDAESARQAFERIRQSASGKDFRGAVIYPMVRGAVEVLIGLSCDPQFGPVVAFGLGGIYTEVFRDVVLRIAPICLDEARRMIHEIRSIKLLTGTRGQPPRDVESLARVLARFSELPFEYPQIAEADLNPVFLLPEGLLVGDVRVIRKSV
ncbi:MAG: acetate--CoA ligase family protein [Anaerolineae bacterium]|nr:acetate--CoA ligase family protein [Anaerolineae bacterium]